MFQFQSEITGKRTYKRHILVYNLVDSQVVLVGNQNGTKRFEKTILPGRRTEEYDEIVADQPPAPFVYTVSNLDNDVRYYINGVDSFSVHWQEFDVYNVLYIVRAPGKYLFLTKDRILLTGYSKSLLFFSTLNLHL